SLYRLALVQSVGISLEMRVVIAETAVRIELIDRVAARLAREQLGNGSIVHGLDRCVAWREDVHRLVNATVAMLVERAFPRIDIGAFDRHLQTPMWDVAAGSDRFAARRDWGVRLQPHLGCDIVRDRRWRTVRLQPPGEDHPGAERHEDDGNRRGAIAPPARHWKCTGVPGLTS